MILRIERHANNSKEVIIDKINIIHMWSPRKYGDEKEEDIEPEIIGGSVFVMDHKEDGGKCYMSECYRDDGTHIIVAFDTVLRIYNDDGKLIDTFIINVR